METCVELIFELFFSVVLELVWDLFAALFSISRTTPTPEPTTVYAPTVDAPTVDAPAAGAGSSFVKALLAGVVGGALGWLSTLVLKRPLLPSPAWQVAFVVVQPVLAATLIGWVDDRRVAAGKRRGLFGDWWTAWAFAFAFALARYVGTR